MSRVPYLDRLGDEFERAVTESAPRRQPRGGTVLAIAFVMVMLAGASLWILRDGRDPDVAETSTTTTTSPEEVDNVDAPTIPETWARIPGDTLEDDRRTTLSGITATVEGFAAAGTASVGDTSPTTGLVLTSSNGIEWQTLVEVENAAINDVAYGEAGLIAVGMRDFLPVAIDENGTVTDLPVIEGSGERAIMARAIAAKDSGYIVIGDESVYDGEQRMRGSIWLSEDGATWAAVESPAFDWYSEAYLNDVIVTPDGIMVIGLAGAESGTTVPMAWLSVDGADWDRIELPTDRDDGFTGASGVAFGHGVYVVVGDKPSLSGAAGTAWVSADGHDWVKVEDEALAGTDRTATRIASVVAVADGFVAVGHSFERPALRHVIWTADTSGTRWSRLDLADPGLDVSTTAYSIAVDSKRVVVAGATFDISFSEASRAIWVGPAPPSLEASAPITPTTVPNDTATDWGPITIDPNMAVGATSVRVVGRLPDGHGLDEVLVQLESPGSTIDFCLAVSQGRNFMCRVTIADLVPQPEPGTYVVVAEGIEELPEPASIEILPEGSNIILMDGIYTPMFGPLVQSVSIQNKGGEDIDIGGWAIVNEGRDDPRFDFPDGSTVPAGLSVGLDFSAPFNAFCPEDTDRYFHWCRAVSDSPRVDYRDEGLLWKGGTLQLLDSNGEVVAEWQPE